MIDLKQLRENPEKFKDGCRKKGFAVDIDHILTLESRKRQLQTERDRLRAEQGKVEKEIGPRLGQMMGQLKKAEGEEKTKLQREIDDLKVKPAGYKAEIARFDAEIAQMDPNLRELLLAVPLPPDADVPVGKSAEDNVEIKRWNPPGFDTSKSFESQRGFKPKTHIELVRDLGLADFERGVKLSGTRSYILTGDGMRLHQAVLRYAMDFMTEKQGFTPVSVPVVVREEAMVGTGFFPAGREQAYHIPESQRQNADDAEGKGTKGYDLFLTGTGEVGLMGVYSDEILDEARLPLKMCTVSTCFRREAGAAGKDTAGLYRIHQFDKVEQVVICRADESESRAWHKKMIGYVEEILQGLKLPYRLIQCCTGDLGPKNADMVDIESWMPGRGGTEAETLDPRDNYVLRATQPPFWANVRPSRIREYQNRCGSDFWVVFYNDSQYYRIPFSRLGEAFVPEVLRPESEEGGERWMVHIPSGKLLVTFGEKKRSIEVGEFIRPNPQTGGYGETHSASRLYDYQCRRLNMRYRPGGDKGKGDTIFCHSLNNTVIASPRVLIPILENGQNADGTVTIPDVLRPYLGGRAKIGPVV